MIPIPGSGPLSLSPTPGPSLACTNRKESSWREGIRRPGMPPVANLIVNTDQYPSNGMTDRLHSAARMAETANRRRALKMSARLSTELTTVPKTKPS